MTRTLTFRVSAADFDKEAAKVVSDAYSAFEKARNDLMRKFMQSERYRAACDVAGYGNSAHKSNPTVSFDGAYLVVSGYIDVASADAKAHEPPLHIDPKLVNAMLHGKLLTDDEKRALVRRIAPGVLKEG